MELLKLLINHNKSIKLIIKSLIQENDKISVLNTRQYYLLHIANMITGLQLHSR